MTEHIIHFNNPKEAHDIVGTDIEVLRTMETVFSVSLTARDAWLKVHGSEQAINRVDRFIAYIRAARSQGARLDKYGKLYALKAFQAGQESDIEKLHQRPIAVSPAKHPLFPKTLGQMKYVQAINAADICFGVGPAGTGKTYLAMAMAVSHLLENRVHRIILTRPAIEAGESLGFLPGDMHDKVLPYLKPLYDALHDMMEADLIGEYMDRGVIEVAPLAYMRGRTLNNSFIILDEAQNTTSEQMMMFLTRMGFDSKCVITGDPTQIDLPPHKISGLLEVLEVLAGISDIRMVRLCDEDVVRHELVRKIIKAYRDSRSSAARMLTRKEVQA